MNTCREFDTKNWKIKNKEMELERFRMIDSPSEIYVKSEGVVEVVISSTGIPTKQGKQQKIAPLSAKPEWRCLLASVCHP